MTASSIPALTLCELADAAAFGIESLSPFCLKTHRALRSRGLSYARRHASHPGAHKLSTTGQVPILLVGDNEIVTDSTRILERVGALTERPFDGDGDAQSRGETWLYEEFADTALNGFLVAARWADDRNWASTEAAYFSEMPKLVRLFVPGKLRRNVLDALVKRDVWRSGPDACWSRFAKVLDRLDARAPREGFWVGSSITAADVALFGQLRSLMTTLTPWQAERVREREALHAYVRRVDQATA